MFSFHIFVDLMFARFTLKYYILPADQLVPR